VRLNVVIVGVSAQDGSVLYDCSGRLGLVDVGIGLVSHRNSMITPRRLASHAVVQQTAHLFALRFVTRGSRWGSSSKPRRPPWRSASVHAGTSEKTSAQVRPPAGRSLGGCRLRRVNPAEPTATQDKRRTEPSYQTGQPSVVGSCAFHQVGPLPIKRIYPSAGYCRSYNARRLRPRQEV
jgi:hypothetical protein